LHRRLPIFYSAILLTIVNLLLRLVGTSFQVYLSGRIGAAGMGLVQLVMSVGGLAVIAGMAGIRTATMYLTAEELGRDRSQNITQVLSTCFLYSFGCSVSMAAVLYCFAPQISIHWIGESRTLDAIRLFAAFVPTTCLCGVLSGYFTAANRIGTLCAIQVCEQLLCMVITMLALSATPGADPSKACQCILLGSGLGGCMTLVCLIVLRIREGQPGPNIPVGRKLAGTAVPLAVADVLKAGINTAENLMVPKRLRMNTSVGDPLAAFGTVSAMVFPILMFPACILYGLAEILIPELARCSAAGSHRRARHLVRKSLRISLLYGAFLCGLMYLLAEDLCITFYKSSEAAQQLKRYALLIPMLYCDAITDAMTKGLGQQKICVRYNILTSAMDVLFLYLLLPNYGMEGYFFSFLITHLVNFLLSLGRLLHITGVTIPLRIPLMTLSAMAASIHLCKGLPSATSRSMAYTALLGSLFALLGLLRREDLQGFLFPEKRKRPAQGRPLNI